MCSGHIAPLTSRQAPYHLTMALRLPSQTRLFAVSELPMPGSLGDPRRVAGNSHLAS